MAAFVGSYAIMRERAHIHRRPHWAERLTRFFDEFGREITPDEDHLALAAAEWEREQAAEFRNED